MKTSITHGVCIVVIAVICIVHADEINDLQIKVARLEAIQATSKK